MKNSEIIKSLTNKYLSLKESKNQELVLDKLFYDTENEQFNETTLKRVDSQGLDFILVGDNPGNKERENQEYFSESGFAGKYARTFLDIASYYHSYGQKPFTYLLFNKTPFHTSTTDKLVINEAVKSSCQILIEALGSFSKSNPNLIILIVGRYKGNELNRVFYGLLEHELKQNKDLKGKVRFAKHFRNGHFYDQWIRNDWEGMKSIDGSSFHSTLTRIHEETYPKINADFKLEFMKEDVIENLNNLLVQVARKRKNNQLTDTSGFMDEIISSARTYSDMTLLLDEEVERNVDEFLKFNEDELKGIKEILQQESELKMEKSRNVKDEEWENAARTRDNLKRINEAKLDELVRLNNFQEGFNAYKGCLLIVRSKDYDKSSVLDQILKELRTAELN